MLRVAARALRGELFFNYGDLLTLSEVLIAARALRGGSEPLDLPSIRGDRI